MDVALAEARDAGLLGKNILGSDFSMRYLHAHRRRRLHLRRRNRAAEFARRLSRPSADEAALPCRRGLYACPTVVNNVETLTAVPHIIKMGGEA